MFYYNKKSMIKSQLLQIDYDRKSGIYFRWNFHDIYDPSHYFRHFIIINSKDVQKTKQFINHYVNRIVAGDFFKIIYGTNGKVVRNLKFRQKMPKQFFDAKRYLKDFNLGLVQIDSLMQKFQQEQLQFSEACVIAIFVDEQSLQKNIIERITNKREQGLYKFLTFIYGPFKYTSLSINSGIHSISHKLQNKPIGHMISYQMNMVYQAAIWKASLQITLNNGELLIQNQKKWRQLQQNRIQRQYYGPSIKYLYDILELYCFEFLTGTYDMLIKFQYKTFSSNVYKSQKRIIINYDYKEQLMKSMDFSHHANLFDDGSMRLQENPFSSISKVKYLKPITTKYQQDEEPKQ